MNLNASKIVKLLAAAFVLSISAISYPQAAVGEVSAALSLTVTRGDDRDATCVPGDCSLREAVNAANASATDDTINFAPGLTRVVLDNNEITINDAGALTIDGPGAPNLTIDGDGAVGKHRIFYTDQTTVVVSGVTLTGGNSFTGGAINANGGSLTLDSVQVTGNYTEPLGGGGGGVYFAGGTHRILNSTISHNIAGSCGGFENSGGTVAVVNSTISDNRAVYEDYKGVGVCNEGGNITLRNVTITNNHSTGGFGVGAGIFQRGGTVSLGNTVVAGNSTVYCCPEIYSFSGPISSAGGNLVGDSPGDSTNTGIPIAYQPTDIRDTNPLLGALQNNGGTTSTHAVLAGSPVIDKGLNALVSPLASVFDQRGMGFPRIRDGNGEHTRTVDIGAFEVQLGLIGPSRFDFDGDGRSDISVFRPSDRVWYLDRSQAGFYAAQFGLSADKIVPSEYDGDGKADIAVYRAGTWYWLNSSNGSFHVRQFGLSGDIPVAADYTGDGRDELAVYRGGAWYTLDLTNDQFTAVHFGLLTDRPVAADYDGDGRTDQAVYRGGIWYLNRSSLGFTAIQFGLPDDKLMPADYDSDGKSDLAVYRNGAWYVLGSRAGFTSFQFGISTDIPAPADYDGDGSTDAAIYRDGVWYMQQSTSGISIQQFGLANDTPLPGR